MHIKRLMRPNGGKRVMPCKTFLPGKFTIMDDVLVMVIYQVKYGEFCSPYLSLFFGKGYQRDGYTQGCF